MYWRDKRLGQIVALLTAVLEAMGNLQKEVQAMSATVNQLDTDIADLQAKVAHDTDVTQSAITLLNGIPALVQDAVQKALAAGATPQELQAITDLSAKLSASSDALAAAVTANTPAPPPAPAPAPVP